MLVLSTAIFVLLRNVDGPALPGVDYKAKIKNQIRSMVDSFRGTGMWSIFTVSAVRGMGDRSLLWVIPFYLKEDLGYGNIAVAVHVALIAIPGIITGPLFGFCLTALAANGSQCSSWASPESLPWPS